MIETRETPRNVLVAAIFCAIIGIITYAGFDTGTAGHKARGFPAGLKMPAIRDEAQRFMP